MKKKYYKSKTLWVNVAAALVLVIEYCLTQKIIAPELHALIIALINIGLRLVTNQGVTK